MANNYDLFLNDISNHPEIDRAVVFYPLDNQNNSSILAVKILNAITECMSLNDAYQCTTKTNSQGNEYYGVMRGARSTNCPRYYIVEHSFYSNLNACNWLLSEDNLRKLARAEAYVIARYYNYTTIKGDVITNGVIDTNDLHDIMLYTEDPTAGTQQQRELADMNFDGYVTMDDFLIASSIYEGNYVYPYI